jgi:hypothetical protein
LFASKFAVIFVCLILPCGIVLVMFLSDLAFDAIEEMGRFFWRDEFRWVTGLACGRLTGSGVPAWVHRRASLLQGAQGRPSVQPGAKEKSRLGVLEWMYVGFAAAWYVVLSIGFGLTLRTPGNHFITGLAIFLFMPGFFAGFCGVCGGAVSARVKGALQEALQGGACTRRFAFGAGMAAGVVSIAGVLIAAVAAYSLSHSEAGVVIGFVGIGAVLTASTFLGLWMVKKKSAL